MRRFLNKNKKWGQLYWANIPLWNPRKEKKIETSPLPFLLPHEWPCDYMHQPGAIQEAMPEKGTARRKLAEMTMAWGNLLGSLIPLGLHGDGAPVQGRMNQSTLVFFTLNLPASGTFQAERVPIVCLEPSTMVAVQHAMPSVKSLRGACKKLGEGRYPEKRHDGSAFHVKK